MAFVLYVAGIALSVRVPEYRLWLQLPANLILMVWFFVMLWHQRRTDAEGEGRATWWGFLTRSSRHFALTVAVFATYAACVLIAAVQPSWQPTLILLGAVPAAVWFLVAAVIHFRTSAATTDRAD
ncbi:hypothetical protein KZC51_03870 [Microbacterium sp. SSW1-49]|uniref:DUF3180 domain-containing protein n=1 Tax=Microbacterium croceum TaxID=2851645 RepID=A0ABT0FB27_9MICO|nr:hypothetical protein [Microbacterium croceum]MCK2035265.1 hypothetical protein [Microbacterium croceum]